MIFLFFFQAEDGIRDYKVTGVQTCALPICTENWKFSSCRPAIRVVLCSALRVVRNRCIGLDKSSNAADMLEKHVSRSEERRVGKECGARWAENDGKKHEERIRHVGDVKNIE